MYLFPPSICILVSRATQIQQEYSLYIRSLIVSVYWHPEQPRYSRSIVYTFVPFQYLYTSNQATQIQEYSLYIRFLPVSVYLYPEQTIYGSIVYIFVPSQYLCTYIQSKLHTGLQFIYPFPSSICILVSRATWIQEYSLYIRSLPIPAYQHREQPRNRSIVLTQSLFMFT